MSFKYDSKHGVCVVVQKLRTYLTVWFQYAINYMRISEDSKTQPNSTLLSSFKALYIINSDFRAYLGH